MNPQWANMLKPSTRRERERKKKKGNSGIFLLNLTGLNTDPTRLTLIKPLLLNLNPKFFMDSFFLS